MEDMLLNHAMAVPKAREQVGAMEIVNGRMESAN